MLDDDTAGSDSDGIHVAAAAAHDGIDEPRHDALRLSEEELLALRKAEPQQILPQPMARMSA